jgi:hypothetical protein
VFTREVFSTVSDVSTGNLWLCETSLSTFQRTSCLLSLVTWVVCEIQTAVTDKSVYIPERSSSNVTILSGGLESVSPCTALQIYECICNNFFCIDVHTPNILETIQGEHKFFPWLQTFITRKLRGIQIYFLPALITNLMHNSFIL